MSISKPHFDRSTFRLADSDRRKRVYSTSTSLHTEGPRGERVMRVPNHLSRASRSRAKAVPGTQIFGNRSGVEGLPGLVGRRTGRAPRLERTARFPNRCASIAIVEAIGNDARLMWRGRPVRADTGLGRPQRLQCSDVHRGPSEYLPSLGMHPLGF
jgi:hypothetical protein